MPTSLSINVYGGCPNIVVNGVPTHVCECQEDEYYEDELMADIGFLKHRHGTPIEWKDSGGTHALTLIGLADGSGRMSVYADLGANWYLPHTITPQVEFASAPTAGLRVDIYLPCSHSSSIWPGGVSGSNAAWPADGNEDEWSKQLGVPDCMLITTNDGSGTVQTQRPTIWRASGRYVCCVVDNNAGVAFHGSNTNSRILLTPIHPYFDSTE